MPSTLARFRRCRRRCAGLLERSRQDVVLFRVAAYARWTALPIHDVDRWRRHLERHRIPHLQGEVGKFTPQPINSVVRDRAGTIFLPVDGSGGQSVLFASKDNGKTWYDTGGRTAGRHTTLVLGKDGSLIGFGGKKYQPRWLHAQSHHSRRRQVTRNRRRRFSRWGAGRGRACFPAWRPENCSSSRICLTKRSWVRRARARQPERRRWRHVENAAKYNLVTVGYTTATQAPNAA